MARKSQDEIKKELLERKAQLELRRAKLTERLKAIEAKENVQKRKDDTRRKIIIGGICLHHAQEKPEFKKWLAENLSRTIKPTEKDLFADLLNLETDLPSPGKTNQ